MIIMTRGSWSAIMAHLLVVRCTSMVSHDAIVDVSCVLYQAHGCNDLRPGNLITITDKTICTQVILILLIP